MKYRQKKNKRRRKRRTRKRMQRVRVNLSMEIRGKQTLKEWIMLENKQIHSQQQHSMVVVNCMEILREMINSKMRTLHL